VGDTGEVSVNRVHEFVKMSLRVHRNKKGLRTLVYIPTMTVEALGSCSVCPPLNAALMIMLAKVRFMLKDCSRKYTAIYTLIIQVEKVVYFFVLILDVGKARSQTCARLR